MTQAPLPESPKSPYLGLMVQSLRVLGLGLGLSAVLFAVRGLPQLPTRAAQPACGLPDAFAIEPQRIPPPTAYDLATLGEVAFVDCRSPEEFQEGHVAGAINLPAEQLQLSAEARQLLSAARTIVTYCDEACARSSKVAQHVVDAGYPDVRIMEGGITAWLNAGYAAESGPCLLCGEVP